MANIGLRGCRDENHTDDSSWYCHQDGQHCSFYSRAKNLAWAYETHPSRNRDYHPQKIHLLFASLL